MRPRLTNRMADLLSKMAAFVQCEAESLGFDGSDDQKVEARELTEAAEWVAELAIWKLSQKK
jgi:hypothetical protein